jgi:hypothetical protein
VSTKGYVKLRRIPIYPDVTSYTGHYYLVTTSGRVFRKKPGEPMREMDNPDYDHLFVHSEAMYALKDYRKYLMKKLNELQRIEEILDEVRHQAEVKKHREENPLVVEED